MCMSFQSSSCSKTNKILNDVNEGDFQTIMEKLDIQNVVWYTLKYYFVPIAGRNPLALLGTRTFTVLIYKFNLLRK